MRGKILSGAPVASEGGELHIKQGSGLEISHGAAEVAESEEYELTVSVVLNQSTHSNSVCEGDSISAFKPHSILLNEGEQPSSVEQRSISVFKNIEIE